MFIANIAQIWQNHRRAGAMGSAVGSETLIVATQVAVLPILSSDQTSVITIALTTIRDSPVRPGQTTILRDR